jgi:hypothetical protein
MISRGFYRHASGKDYFVHGVGRLHDETRRIVVYESTQSAVDGAPRLRYEDDFEKRFSRVGDDGSSGYPGDVGPPMDELVDDLLSDHPEALFGPVPGPLGNVLGGARAMSDMVDGAFDTSGISPEKMIGSLEPMIRMYAEVMTPGPRQRLTEFLTRVQNILDETDPNKDVRTS